jgi:hypothetical protein
MKRATSTPGRRREVAGIVICAVVVALCHAAATRAQSLAQMPAPVFEVERICIEGYLGPPQPRPRTTELTLGYKGKISRFQLTRLQVLFGDELYSDILAGVQPYRPNFILHGPPSEMEKLDTARPGEPVEISGTIHEGGRNVLVQSIRVRPPGTP